MIEAGSILMEKNTQHPVCFKVCGDSDSSGWSTMRHDLTPLQLEKQLADEKWTFFYMAGSIKTMAFGSQGSKTALARAVASARRSGFNCLVIDTVSAHSFLGLPYTSISAHSRHIQQGTHSIQKERGASL